MNPLQDRGGDHGEPVPDEGRGGPVRGARELQAVLPVSLDRRRRHLAPDPPQPEARPGPRAGGAQRGEPRHVCDEDQGRNFN